MAPSLACHLLSNILIDAAKTRLRRWGDGKPVIGSRKREIGNRKSETGNQKSGNEDIASEKPITVRIVVRNWKTENRIESNTHTICVCTVFCIPVSVFRFPFLTHLSPCSKTCSMALALSRLLPCRLIVFLIPVVYRGFPLSRASF